MPGVREVPGESGAGGQSRAEAELEGESGAPGQGGGDAMALRGAGAAGLVAGLALRLGVGAGRIVLLRYPPQRGTRRERLRREAEEARQAIAGGRPVRLTHVVELPPTPGGDDSMPEGSRRMSPAVGEVAKRFAPDLSLGRLVRPWTGPRISPEARAESTVGATPADAGHKGLQSRPPPRGSLPKAASQQIGVVLADALAAARLDGANEAPGPEPLDAVTAPPAPRAPSAGPRPRTHIVVAIVAGAAIAAALAVAVFVRRHNESRPAVSRADVQVDANASASVVPGSSVPAPTPTPAQDPSPVKPSPPPSRPAPSSSSGEYARAFAMGETLLKQGRYRAAIAEYRKAVALRPDSVAALIALGDAFLEADQPRNALKPLLTAAQLDPGSARAQLLLGTAFQSLGRPREAVSAYKRYIELEPNGEFAGDVRAIVANLSR